MAHSSADFIRQGYPIKVEWMGWTTDTLRLRGHGWDMATEYDMRSDRMNVIFHHRKFDLVARGHVGGLHRMISFAMGRHSDYYSMDGAVIAIESMGLASRTVVHAVSDFTSAYSWVDMEPSIEPMRAMKMSELGLFRRLQAPVEQELIVDPECVQSMLDQILKLQGPMRKDIRARDASRERDQPPARQIHAQIISFAEAA